LIVLPDRIGKRKHLEKIKGTYHTPGAPLRTYRGNPQLAEDCKAFL
jgi:hypothetical protein